MATNIEANRFYYFEIPAAINGSNLDPSPVSNVTSNFTDSKLSFKLGFPFFKQTTSMTLKHTGFIQPSFKATTGITTLYKANSAPVEYGITAGYSLVLGHLFWVYKNNDESLTSDHSSERIWWLNFIGNVEHGNYNLFDQSKTYGEILDKRTETNGSIYASFNYYFYSKIPKYKWENFIASAGFGYAKANNYATLKNRSMDEGTLVQKPDSSVYQTVVETTSGKIGDFIVSEGMSGFGELFIPIKRSDTYGSLYFGNRATFYNLDNKKTILNGVTGFYFNVKDQKKVGDKPAKDILNFSVTAQFLQLNKSSVQNYADNNFSVVLQAAIPLRFN